ncbi:hypothetical protein [Lederbergia citrea]|uniref:hypothetical protein n=1 Tax=Lederbergia citrea TaxID=2833581 RepID=UPI001BC8F975|nr:hypothetical protein [Lederbergia citrea]MBS4205310.1 hypothetical protein [Lederbergia citrea]
MKNHAVGRELIYVHMNNSDHFVLSYGIEFSEFIKGIPVQIPNVLLLRHKFEEGHFNMHTKLDYADSDMIRKLLVENVYGYGDFCWIDFEDEEHLDQLSGQEIAEILYLGHLKDHLRLPFYGKLSNRFAYLAGDDGWCNKIYYRSWNHFYMMLGQVISTKINGQKEKFVFGLWKKKAVPAVPPEILHPFSNYMKEGLAFSIEKAVKSRQQIEIPVWVIGDFYDMDAMYEEYELINNKTPDGKIVFDRKTGEWQAYSSA